MKYRYHKTGFTFLELILGMIISSILIVVIGVVILDTQRSWSDSCAKAFSGAANEGLIARTVFDSVIRKASRSNHQLSGVDDLTVYYYADWENSTAPDRRARLYRSELNPSEMYVEHTAVGDGSLLSKVLLSEHVTDLEFSAIDDGYTMKVSLDDGREQITVVSAAIMHN